MDAEIADSTAKLAVYKAASECSNKSQTPSDGMNLYLQRRKRAKMTQPCSKNRFNHKAALQDLRSI